VYRTREDRDRKRNGKPEVRLFVQKSPFRIIATRSLVALGNPQDVVPMVTANEISSLKPDTPCIVWRTAPNGLAWSIKDKTTNTILSVVKPGAARYIGFGEQGGMSLFKYSTYMNYFGMFTNILEVP
jgi:hypothetical protein